MTVVPVQPIVLDNVELLIDVDDYAAHVSTVRFDPSSSVVTWKGLSPTAKFSKGTTPTWTATITYAQDWTTPNSLSQYLMTHAGETKAAVFQPKKGTGLPAFLADVIIVPGPIGGDVDTVQTGSVTLGVDGDVTFDADGV